MYNVLSNRAAHKCITTHTHKMLMQWHLFWRRHNLIWAGLTFATFFLSSFGKPQIDQYTEPHHGRHRINDSNDDLEGHCFLYRIKIPISISIFVVFSLSVHGFFFKCEPKTRLSIETNSWNELLRHCRKRQHKPENKLSDCRKYPFQ